MIALVVIATSLTPTEWGGVIGAVLTGLAAVIGGIAAVVRANAPVELAEVEREGREITQRHRAREREESLAKSLLADANAKIERLQQALDSKEHELSMVDRSNVGLATRAERLEEVEVEHRSCRQLVESQNTKITSLEVKLAVCETNHANADARAAWLEARLDKIDGGHERNPSIPAPPKPRSVTPVHGTPSVSKEQT